MMSRNRLPWIIGILVLTVIALFGAGWVLASGADRTDTGLGSLPPSNPPPSSAPASAPGGTSGQDGAATGRSGEDGSQGGSDSGNPGDQSRGPRIEIFRVVQDPRCPGGTNVNPIEGTPATLEWTVTGAEEVTLSIDGPGIYGTYPAEGGDTISFPCEGSEGDTQEHTYLLTAVGDGVTRTETLVVTATVHEVTNVG
jgi:hypothetical protein